MTQHADLVRRINLGAGMTPQCETLFNHLAKHREKGITILEAGHLYKIAFSAVPRRIADIRQAIEPHGMTIRSDRRRDPTGHVYVRYFLENLETSQ